MLPLLQLFFDSGTFVLIWMVQLVIYPSFLFYSSSDLISWHKTYTVRITMVVMPLMVGQLFLTLYALFEEVNTISIARGVLVLLIWISTFLIFVPIHNSIQAGKFNTLLLQKLVQRNWFRTLLWTLILATSPAFWN
ncbi:MAG: hypothetical protein AAFU57_05035 [Bacteroidota bacterium]